MIEEPPDPLDLTQYEPVATIDGETIYIDKKKYNLVETYLTQPESNHLIELLTIIIGGASCQYDEVFYNSNTHQLRTAEQALFRNGAQHLYKTILTIRNKPCQTQHHQTRLPWLVRLLLRVIRLLHKPNP